MPHPSSNTYDLTVPTSTFNVGSLNSVPTPGLYSCMTVGNQSDPSGNTRLVSCNNPSVKFNSVVQRNLNVTGDFNCDGNGNCTQTNNSQ